MELKEIHKSIKTMLTNKFNIPVLSLDSPHSNSKPFFKVELILDSISRNNKTIDDYNLQILIDYVATKRNDIAFYNIISQMQSLFNRYIIVGTRFLHITSFDFIDCGDNNEEIEFTIETKFKDRIVLPEPTETMDDFEIKEM